MLELSDHGFCSTGWGDENNVTLLGKSEGKRLLEEPGCRGKDNIKINFKRLEWDCVDWLIWLSTEPAMDYCKQDNRPQYFIQDGYILVQPSDCWLPKNDSIPGT